jgi:hypothetical protein
MWNDCSALCGAVGGGAHAPARAARAPPRTNRAHTHVMSYHFLHLDISARRCREGRDTLSYLCDTVRCADSGFTLFHSKQLWNPRNAQNPSNRLVRPRGGGAAPAGDAFAWSGMFGGSPKPTATDEGPEATTRSVRASVATVGTALPLAGPMCSAIFVANELPDVGVRVSCRICGAGRSSSGIWAARCTCGSLAAGSARSATRRRKIGIRSSRLAKSQHSALANRRHTCNRT